MKVKDICINGHVRSEDNLLSNRTCKECARTRSRAWSLSQPHPCGCPRSPEGGKCQVCPPKPRNRKPPEWKLTGKKVCTCCKLEKAVEDFYPKGKSPSHLCRDCMNAKSASVYHSLSPEARKLRIHKARLVSFGLTEVEFLSLRDSQNNCCKICGRAEYGQKRLAIDHDHVTGKVRGLLCASCNTKLGWYEKFSSEIEGYLS